MWDAQAGAFHDYDWRLGQRRTCLTAACTVPLFAGLADEHQAAATARTVAQRLLAPGGLSTSECRSDQQWDRPNGWAPLQWMAFAGMRRYGHTGLADAIAHRWLATVAALYEREGRLVEKYALRTVEHDRTQAGGGGEYVLQDGFGWTNGVTAAMLALHPAHAACRSCANTPSEAHR
jgi:alpha,alpha-trehalase